MKKNKNCTKGINCGATCIQSKLICTSAVPGAASRVANAASGLIIKLGSGSFGSVIQDRDGNAIKTFDTPKSDVETRAATQRTNREQEISFATAAGDLGVGPRVLSAERDDSGFPIGFKMESLTLKGYKTAQEISGSRIQKMSIDWFERAESGPALVALAKLHRAGISHGDLNTGNFMIKGSEAKLIDYGLSKRIEAEPKQWARELMVTAGAVSGAPYRKGSKESRVRSVMSQWAERLKQGEDALESYRGYSADMSRALED